MDDDSEDWMWERARALLESAERLQVGVFGVVPPGGRTPTWTPPVDVFELPGGQVWVLVALPGIALDHVTVLAAPDHLIVEGRRGLPAAFRDARVHRLESPYGHFHRRIDLPAGHFTLEQRELVQGCLVLRLHRDATRHDV